LLINHFIPDKAYCINCTPLYLDSSYPEEYLNEDTIEKYDNEDFTELELHVEKIDYNYLYKLNVVQCGCPCKYGRLNGLDTTSFYKNECFDQWKEFKEWKYFKCFFEKSCSTGNIYRGKISSNSTFSTTTTITSPKANKDFTTKQPEISVGKNETELESSQINDDKELEFEKIDYNHLERINVVQCGCPCKYGKINGLANTSFYKNECFDQSRKLMERNSFNCYIEESCSTGIVYRGELRSNTTTTTTTTTTATSTKTSTDIVSTSNVTTTSSNIETEKIDNDYLNVVQCGCPCKYGKINGLANTSFYKNECFDQWKELKEWKYFKCFFEKSCSTGNIYRGKLSSNSTSSTTTTITSPTAIDFTSPSNVTLTSSNIEIEKIDLRYLIENTTEKYDNKDFTTKQPEISVGKSETELESSQINDDKELEFVTTSKLKIEKIETPTNFIDENPSITPTSKPEIDFTTDKNNGIYNFINSIQLIKEKLYGNDKI
jgi:hypothetical protein